MAKLIPIDKVVCIERLYPRNQVNWMTVYDYQQSIRAGAVFPPIIVALFQGSYVLVDGWHRLEAYKRNKEEYIPVNILKRLSEEEIYVEAIRRNIAHGRQFSQQEKAEIVLRLRDMRMPIATISSLIQIPTDKMERFMSERLVNVATGEEVITKAPLKYLAGRKLKLGKDEFDDVQSVFESHSQTSLLDEVITLLSKGLLNFKNAKVKIRILTIYKLIGKLIKKHK